MSKLSPFTNGKPFTVTEADAKAPWGGDRKGKYFRCYLCGHRFVVGDTCRFECSKDGNFLTCSACDGPNVKEAWAKMRREFKTKYWYFIKDM